MATIYNPWQVTPEEPILQEGSAAIAYAEQREEMLEEQYPEADSGEAEHESGSPHEMMAEALSIMNEQQQLIKDLTAQLMGGRTDE